MSEKETEPSPDKEKPPLSSKQKRLALALRKNLHRRKDLKRQKESHLE